MCASVNSLRKLLYLYHLTICLWVGLGLGASTQNSTDELFLDFTKAISFTHTYRKMVDFCLISFSSWAGVRLHTSGAEFPVHHDMPSSGGVVSAPFFVLSGAGRSDLSNSMSCSSSRACVALQQASSPGSSRKGSFLWDDSTRCSHHNGSTTGRWCVGRSATR